MERRKEEGGGEGREGRWRREEEREEGDQIRERYYDFICLLIIPGYWLTDVAVGFDAFPKITCLFSHLLSVPSMPDITLSTALPGDRHQP